MNSTAVESITLATVAYRRRTLSQAGSGPSANDDAREDLNRRRAAIETMTDRLIGQASNTVN